MLIVDLFCGAGGTTIGFEQTGGLAQVIAAVNHDPKAIESHWINHPDVVHYEEDIRTLDLTDLVQLVKRMRKKYPSASLALWASLECTNFSKAKGGLPRDADSRTLADHLHRYIHAIDPDLVMIENVVEFMSWGPLDDTGKPVSRLNGQDWLRWKNEVNKIGYRDDWRQLNSADFGARTSRNRLFGLFAKPHLTIAWPDPSHAKNPGKSDMFSMLKKWEPCRPCLDLEDHGTSIFTNGKIRSEKTFERILAGLIKYVAGMGQKEFICKYFSGQPESKNILIDGPCGTIKTKDSHALCQMEFLVKYNSMAVNGDMRHSVNSIEDPAPTVTCQRQPNVVTCIGAYYGKENSLRSTDAPAPTLTCADTMSKIDVQFLDQQFGSGTKHRSIDYPHGTVMPCPKSALVTPVLIDTQFNNAGRSIDEPAPTITANRKWHYIMNPQYFNRGASIDGPHPTLIARMDKMPPYLVQAQSGEVCIVVYDTDLPVVRKIKLFMAMYGIADIKMRMLKIVELKRIQGFPESYELKGTQADQKKFIGNSVHPVVPKEWALALCERNSNN
jgi:DNA (cytosine-5)-methyltransferase 1